MEATESDDKMAEFARPDALDARRYRYMRQNIDYVVFKDGSGHYFHNQRGEFSFCGPRMPPFEELLDAAMDGEEP